MLRINHYFGRVIEGEWEIPSRWTEEEEEKEKRRRKGGPTERRKTEVESHGNDLFPWSRGSHRTRGILVSVYRVFRKCKPGTTRLHSAPEAPDGKSRGGLESIKCLVNKVTHFEIYEYTDADTLNALARDFGNSLDHLADFPGETTSIPQPEYRKRSRNVGKRAHSPPNFAYTRPMLSTGLENRHEKRTLHTHTYVYM